MSRYLKSTLQVFIAFIFIVGAFGTSPVRPVEAASTNVVISEVYGGGSNTDANYKNDFIELFNLGTTLVDLSGWSVQYASATGTTWSKTNLTGNIPAGGYYLIQGAGTDINLLPLPTPDVIGTLNLSGTSGKVALLNNQTTLPTTGVTSTYSGIIDFVGFGSANLFEGNGPTATLSNITSAARTILCFDADDNFAEFAVGTQTPQNSATPVSVCPSDAVYLATIPTNGSKGVLVGADLALNFNQVVTPSAGWYSLSCTISGMHTASVIPDSASITFTLNPDTNFAYAEACTLTIIGSLLTPAMAYSPTIKFSTAANLADVCGDPYTPISAIQGSGSASPFAGLQLATEGVVTADLQSTKKGFYLQDPNPDADPLTSEGMLIYVGSTVYTLSVGDRVRVAGTATEFNGLTEMTGPFPRLLNCGPSGLTIPPVELALPFADTRAANLEPLENMLVHFAQPLVINDYYYFDRYGEIILSSKRLDTPTNVVAPGADAAALQAANDLDKITLDDGVSSPNPDFLPHPNGGYYCQGTLLTTRPDLCPAVNIFRGGDKVSNLTAVVDYVAGGWKLIKTKAATYAPLNPRPLAPDLVPGEIRISSINTLNYFITLNNTTTTPCGPLEDQDCRGAKSVEEFDRQRPKTIATVIGMASDITGLLELENDNPTTTAVSSPDYAIKDIVAGLNAVAGPGVYDYIATGAIGGDAIKAGIVYKPARVTPVGAYATLTSAVDPAFVDTCNRPVLAQTFRDNITQEIFTVAINHLKSKSSACAALNDIDTGDGQGNANLTRTMAAAVQVKWLETDPTGQGSQMYLIMGDLNSYAMEDPITAIKNGADGVADTADDYFDLVQRFRELFGYPKSYGYVYSAQAGYLDGALANRRMASYVLDAKEWHINADEVDAIDYTFQSYKRTPGQKDLYQLDAYRSSDHDPILVSLMLNHDPISVDDVYTSYQNRTLAVGVADGVLANDVDFNVYDNITAELLTQPANGLVVMQLDGSLTYTPNPDFVGMDTFKYEMQATPGLMSAYANTATVTITVEFKPFLMYLPIIAK
jgi:predicted extracellular nuclease